MAVIDKDLVMKSFDFHAQQYDSLAQVQKKVISRLKENMKAVYATPASLLDIGSGTGRLLSDAAEIYPDADLVGIDLAFGMARVASSRMLENNKAAFVCGDAEKLPFQSSSFDLVISTSTYQWVPLLKGAFSEVHRVLKPGSRFIFALFGEKTLFELKESYRKALKASKRTSTDPTHRFATPGEVAMALTGSGFINCRVYEEMETETYPDVPELLRSIKGIGAGNASRRESSGLAGKNEILRMMEHYRTDYGTADGVPASYHVLYGSGLKS